MIEITKWSLCFESADTRKRQRLGWFLSPSGCDSKGFRKLMRDGKDGLATLGFFQALCQSMATQNASSRKVGIFQNSDGELMDFDDIMELSRLNGMAPADYQQIIGRLVSVGWICLHKSLETEQSATCLPPVCQSHPGFVKGEGEGKGQGEGKEQGQGGERAPSGEEDEIFKLWNSFRELQKIAKVSAERKAKAKIRLRDSFFREHWKSAIEKIAKTPFLLGQNDRGWTADIDWFLKPESLTRIVEGKYASTPPTTQANQPRNMDVSGKILQLPKSKQY